MIALAVLGMACGDEEQTAAVEAPAEKTSEAAEEAAVAVADPPALPTATEFERAYDKPEDVPEELRVIWEAWDILSQEYVDTSKLDSDAIVAGAVRGMLSVLDDPQTAYVEPSTMQSSFGDMFRGDFEGIGAHVQINAAGKIVIVSPIEGSPAEAAGIRPGDIILEVDGESIEGWGLLDVVSIIRGPKGTKVTLLIKHLLALDPVEVTITRGVIELSSVLLRSEPGERFPHVRITEFYPNTVDQLREILQQVQRDGAEGLILDLRNNPGGPLQSVVDVASQFLDDGLVLYVQRGDGRRTDWRGEARRHCARHPYGDAGGQGEWQRERGARGGASGPRPRNHHRGDHIRERQREHAARAEQWGRALPDHCLLVHSIRAG